MKHNHKAIFGIVVINQFLGFLWYSPWLFMTPWMKGLKLEFTAEDQANPLPFVIAIVGTVATIYLLSWLIQRLDLRGFFEGARLGATLACALALPLIFTHYAFAQIAWIVGIIDAGNCFVSLTLSAGLLGIWRPKPH